MKQIAQTISIILLGLVIGGSGSFFVSKQFANDQQTFSVDDESSQEQKPDLVDRSIGGIDAESNSKHENTLIAGDDHLPYREFDYNEYEASLIDGKIIFLYFCSSIDPICEVESPDIAEGFDKIIREQLIENIVGFYVDFKSEQANGDERKMAELLDVKKQHTKLILVDGQEKVRSTDAWTTTRFNEAIESVAEE